MGTVQARQQALVSSRNSLTAAGSHLAGGPGAPPDPAARAVPPSSEAHQDERIPVVFTWNHGGQQVYLAASFNSWREQIPMVRSGNEFHVVQELPRGIHQYKFIVDDQWRFAPDQPKTQDSDGNMNNILDIVNYQRWRLEEEQHREEQVPQQRFGQHIPDPHDYTLDPPQIPIVLSKSVLCAIPLRSSAQPLNIPTHAISDHVYLHDHVEGGSVFALAKVAVTHRFGNSYSTNVFITRSPFDGCGFAEGTEKRPVNLLKKAMRGR
uniref:Association with the SNF1 complex (ASC) domain-containing protein n=1 Tax=Alexandrium monilatum TaxID=311494 RepID=A0A7S4VAH1_9DINO